MTELQIVNECRAALNDAPVANIADDPMNVSELQPLIANQVLLVQSESSWIIANTTTLIAVTSIGIRILPGHKVTEAVSGAKGTLLWAEANEYLYIAITPGSANFTGGQVLTFTDADDVTIGLLNGGVRTDMMPNQEWTLMQLPRHLRRLVSAESAREWARIVKRGGLEEQTLAQKIQRRKEAADRWDAGIAAAIGIDTGDIMNMDKWDYPTDEITNA